MTTPHDRTHPPTSACQVSHLLRREIQAPIAAALIREFALTLGTDRAVEIATAAVSTDAEAAGREAAGRLGGGSLAGLERLVREVWSAGDAMTVRFLESTERRLSFDVTRCAYADLYERLGMQDLGFCLSCSRDEPFARGFNPRLRLAHTRTIMQGAPSCDFRFDLD
jgi:hypothetical protein